MKTAEQKEPKLVEDIFTKDQQNNGIKERIKLNQNWKNEVL